MQEDVTRPQEPKAPSEPTSPGPSQPSEVPSEKPQEQPPSEPSAPSQPEPEKSEESAGPPPSETTPVKSETPSATPSPAAPGTAEEAGFDPKDIEDNKVMAALSYLWILSVIMWAIKKDSKFTVFHAKQGLVLFGISILNWIVDVVTPWYFINIINWLIGIAVLVFVIIGFVQAIQGRAYKVPLVYDIAKGLKI